MHQPAVDRITARLEAEGFEVIHFHASGPGGRALESLAAAGELAGVIDLTTSELTDFITGGVYSAGEARLTAAGAAGIPQVVVPGCLDFTNWWVGQVPDKYRQREFYQYNVEILLMRTNAEEFSKLGRLFGERLRTAKGPLSVLIPGGGMSQLVGRKTYDIAGNERGAWTQPEIDKVFGETLKRYLPAGSIKELPYHINDAGFADACAAFLGRHIASRFHVGCLRRQRLVLDDGSKPFRHVMPQEMKLPRFIVHAVSQLHEELEILRAKVEASVRSAEIEADVFSELALGILALMPSSVDFGF